MERVAGAIRASSGSSEKTFIKAIEAGGKVGEASDAG